MDRLPEEILVLVLSFLSPVDIANCQRVCRRLLVIGRDDNLWKAICFENSQADSVHRRQQAIADQEARLATLREAINESLAPHASDHVAAIATNGPQNGNDAPSRRQQAFANWDPGYPSEQASFYEEYIHRHAPISLSYFHQPSDHFSTAELYHESLGIGALNDDATGEIQKILAPLDDGSICLWDAARDSETRGRIIARTSPGYLSNSGIPLSKLPSSETGAVDNISVDSRRQKAFIANENYLHEIDLNTLSIVRSQPFPFPITALSESRSPTPLTIGTNTTLHLFDVRVNRPQLNLSLGSKCELIGGSPAINSTAVSGVPSRHVSLSQPGPVSILHLPSLSNHSEPSDAIWVAGRFTSLLHYDRRFWPKIQGTIFSGARLSSISYLAYPFIHPQLRSSFSDPLALRSAKTSSGMTIIAAGEYKGKGSLEMYGIRASSFEPNQEPQSTLEFQAGDAIPQHYHNRQYASKSRLLSVAPHGTRIVFSDGDGLLKFVERDAWTVVRSFNINTAHVGPPSSSRPSPDEEAAQIAHDSTTSQASRRIRRPHQPSIFAAQSSDDPDSDIVRKILPLSSTGSSELNTRDLMIWTGDGKIGLLEFGRKSARSFDGPPGQNGDERGELVEDIERERVYADRMREALERQADEARWVRGLGLGL